MGAFASAQVAALSMEQLAALSPKQLSALSPQQTALLTGQAKEHLDIIREIKSGGMSICWWSLEKLASVPPHLLLVRHFHRGGLRTRVSGMHHSKSLVWWGRRGIAST